MDYDLCKNLIKKGLLPTAVLWVNKNHSFASYGS
jgi:hypothetical protein